MHNLYNITKPVPVSLESRRVMYLSAALVSQISEMANADTSDYLLKQDAGGHVDSGHLCVERLFVILRNPTLI